MASQGQPFPFEENNGNLNSVEKQIKKATATKVRPILTVFARDWPWRNVLYYHQIHGFKVEGDPKGPPFSIIAAAGEFRAEGVLLIGCTLKHSNTRNGGNGCMARAAGREASTLKRQGGGKTWDTI